jgi:hypothetical protein
VRYVEEEEKQMECPLNIKIGILERERQAAWYPTESQMLLRGGNLSFQLGNSNETQKRNSVHMIARAVATTEPGKIR